MVASVSSSESKFMRDGITIYNANVMDLYEMWDPPIVIISDGAYGVGGFPGDLPTPEGLAKWYEPHIIKWTQKATPQTTLWFWNTEIGWAIIHQVLAKRGWKYVCCHTWDKGIAHIAGNSNTQSLRKFPIVTEVCVQYVKEPRFVVDSKRVLMKEWLRHEWKRTGLPFYKANEACGVRNAASRKYLTKDHLWYYPPVESFQKMVAYAERHGDPNGRPYFSLDGENPTSEKEWGRMRAKFYCEAGITNVWNEPPMHGEERIKNGDGYLHLNQKPLRLNELIIRASSDVGDLVWEPFGGLCSGAIASQRLGRRCLSAEIIKEYYEMAVRRLASSGTNARARENRAIPEVETHQAIQGD